MQIELRRRVGMGGLMRQSADAIKRLARRAAAGSDAAGTGDAMTERPLVRALDDLPEEGWDDPARGAARWKTLFSAGRTPTAGLTCGVASLPPGGRLPLHRHTQREVYFGLEGRARVTLEDAEHELAPGVAVFIPGDALHGVEAGDAPVRFFYVFPADGFDEIVYRF